MRIPLLIVLAVGVMAGICVGAATEPGEDASAPHTPTLIFYLTGAATAEDEAAIRAAIQKEKSAAVVEVNTMRSYARVRFDSHVVSYHQIAQAIVDGGASVHKKYDPVLLISVPEYRTKAANVDLIFAGKRLNTRVKILPVNKSEGLFQIHFLPLVVNPKDASPQGFNGGHLHHPLSDPEPRGLALPSSYASVDDPSLFPVATTAPASAPTQ